MALRQHEVLAGTTARNAPLSLASSTRMISLSSGRGERLMTLWMVLSSVDHASLWNTITTLVSGSSEMSPYDFLRHLRKQDEHMSNSERVWCVGTGTESERAVSRASPRSEIDLLQPSTRKQTPQDGTDRIQNKQHSGPLTSTVFFGVCDYARKQTL